MQSRDSFDDYGGLTEVPPHHEPPQPAQNNAAASGSPAVSQADSPLPGSVNGSASQASPPPALAQAPAAATSVSALAVAASAVAAASPPPAAGALFRAASITPHDDDPREPAVPRGTFASEVPDRSADGDDRESVRSSEREPSAPKAPRPTASAGHLQRSKSMRPVARPPYLASEILREDLTP
ncbi:MAG: hypothetical protein JWN04_3681, partial [Myxococcaceae bacterium]|nr:hypothetical protein [Myxococcaceae bacterium]